MRETSEKCILPFSPVPSIALRPPAVIISIFVYFSLLFIWEDFFCSIFSFTIDSLYSPTAGTSLKADPFSTCYFFLLFHFCFCWLLEQWWTALTFPLYLCLGAIFIVHIPSKHGLLLEYSQSDIQYIPLYSRIWTKADSTKLCVQSIFTGQSSCYRERKAPDRHRPLLIRKNKSSAPLEPIRGFSFEI